MEATTRDLRLHTKEVLSATRRGEDVIITYRGKPTARLVPIQEEQKADRNPGFGMWADHQELGVDQQVRNLRKRRKFD
ncbi:type II toxin-antitoxin system Phd/YefM family antitoxin [Marinobacter bryozoorum]|uniref:type II toxin-antitoxin system Phd/YefM family antitoxin n=1 Tax=Marinobacter bryozoorum TaxID=256324 RepID=UPI003D03B7C9